MLAISTKIVARILTIQFLLCASQMNTADDEQKLLIRVAKREGALTITGRTTSGSGLFSLDCHRKASNHTYTIPIAPQKTLDLNIKSEIPLGGGDLLMRVESGIPSCSVSGSFSIMSRDLPISLITIYGNNALLPNVIKEPCIVHARDQRTKRELFRTIFKDKCDERGFPILRPVLYPDNTPMTELVMDPNTGTTVEQPRMEKIVEPALDENGNQIVEPILEHKKDKHGKLLYKIHVREVTAQDSSGNSITVTRLHKQHSKKSLLALFRLK